MRRLKNLWLLAIGLIMLDAAHLWGGHLVAGTMHYVCLRKQSNSVQLSVVLRVIRDCRIEDPIGYFDSSPQSSITGTVTIYAGGDARPVQTIILANPNVSRVFPVPTYPCLEQPRENCLELGEYVMDVTLPIINDSYYIIYQRCCRSQILQNILAPESTGVSYWLEITPEGLRACNSSPLFQGFPPLSACVAQSFSHPLGISDPDRDEVRLRLAAPYKGGGPTNPPAGLNGIAPDPDAPPPYDTVRYLSNFTSQQPFGPNSSLTLNQQVLTGYPGQLGLYLIGVNIEDYRQGQLMSRSGVDLQVSVVTCAPLVEASVVGRANATRDTFTIDQCGPGALAIINNSTQAANIKTWRWQWTIMGQDPAFTSWDADFAHLPVGTYYGRLALNSQDVCKDEAVIKVNIFPAIQADFALPSPSCEHQPLTFIPQVGHTAPLRSMSWSVSPGSLKINTDTLFHLFNSPGTHQVTLEATDSNGCSARVRKEFLYAPLDSATLLARTPQLVCLPDSVDLNPFHFLNHSTYQFSWDFGSGALKGVNPRVSIDRPGVYDLTYTITSPLGCSVSGLLPGFMRAIQKPKIDFTTLLNEGETPRKLTLAAQNLLSEPLEYHWWINDDSVASGENYRYPVPQFGTYTVKLVGLNDAGCRAEVVKTVQVESITQFYLPNIFSPNGDGTNDTWQPVGLFEGLTAFTTLVYDRWGTLVFKSNDPNMGWDGRFHGIPVPPGVYAVIMRYVDVQGQVHLLSESITLLR